MLLPWCPWLPPHIPQALNLALLTPSVGPTWDWHQGTSNKSAYSPWRAFTPHCCCCFSCLLMPQRTAVLFQQWQCWHQLPRAIYTQAPVQWATGLSRGPSSITPLPPLPHHFPSADQSGVTGFLKLENKISLNIKKHLKI